MWFKEVVITTEYRSLSTNQCTYDSICELFKLVRAVHLPSSFSESPDACTTLRKSPCLYTYIRSYGFYVWLKRLW